MISLLSIFCTWFVIALSGALMPGPVLTVTVSESARRGAAAGPLMIFARYIFRLLSLQRPVKDLVCLSSVTAATGTAADAPRDLFLPAFKTGFLFIFIHGIQTVFNKSGGFNRLDS